MQVIKLGQLIADEPKRDAVHVAVVPVTLAGQVYPGDHVGLDRNGRASTLAPTLIGVIDPFLKDVQLRAGSRVWMFLYPGSTNQLRHDWSHPSIPDDHDEPKINYGPPGNCSC